MNLPLQILAKDLRRYWPLALFAGAYIAVETLAPLWGLSLTLGNFDLGSDLGLQQRRRQHAAEATARHRRKRQERAIARRREATAQRTKRRRQGQVQADRRMIGGSLAQRIGLGV